MEGGIKPHLIGGQGGGEIGETEMQVFFAVEPSRVGYLILVEVSHRRQFCGVRVAQALEFGEVEHVRAEQHIPIDSFNSLPEDSVSHSDGRVAHPPLPTVGRQAGNCPAMPTCGRPAIDESPMTAAVIRFQSKDP